MFKDRYKKELDNITLSDDFKNATVQLMLEKSRNNSPAVVTKAEIIRFPKKAARNIAAACFIFILAIYTFTSDKIDMASFDSAENESAPAQHEYSREDFTDNCKTESDTDFINGVIRKETVYTEKNIQPIEYGTTGKDIPAGKLIYTNPAGGGMGFESHMAYDISDLDSGNPFSAKDTFDYLPVYKYNRVTARDVLNTTDVFLNSIGKSREDITKATWEVIGFGNKYGSFEEFIQVLDNRDKNGDIPPFVTFEFDGGKIKFTNSLGSYSFNIYNGIDYGDNRQLVKYFCEDFKNIGGVENRTGYTFTDYYYTGELNYNNYIYSPGKSYGENIFNYSVEKLRFYNQRDYKTGVYYVGGGKNFARYTNRGEIPAINRMQALGLLYDGKYISGCPDFEQLETKQVNKIELIYKDAPLLFMSGSREGLALPFYKFYADSGTKDRETGLKHFYVYYVCAIHPDYIEITEEDGYSRFN